MGETPDPLDEARQRLSPWAPPGAAGPPPPPDRLGGGAPDGRAASPLAGSGSPYSQSGQTPAPASASASAPGTWSPDDAVASSGTASPPLSREQRRRRTSRRAAVGVGVGIGVLALVGVIVASTTIVPAAGPDAAGTTAPHQSGSSKVVAGWEHYPGTASADSEQVVAQRSKEAAVAASASFIEAAKTRLTAELGVEWAENSPVYEQREPNDYGGTSMLWEYDSAEWQGVVVLDDPGTRERVHQLVSGPASAAGYVDPWRENESYSGDDVSSKREFGASDLIDQPLWRYIDQSSTGYAITSVLDLNLERDTTFTGGRWFDLSHAPEGAVLITISTSDTDLLAMGDVARFQKERSGYDEWAKPLGLD